MTLKAAWLTPWPESNLCSLTLESASTEPMDRVQTQEHIFPQTPVDAPKRHTVELGLLSVQDLDLLRQLLDGAAGYGGYERFSVRAPEAPAVHTPEEDLNG